MFRLFAVLSLTLASGLAGSGCASIGWFGKHDSTIANPQPANKIDGEKSASAVTPPPAAASPQAVDPQAMAAVIAQMSSLGELDAATQTRLMDDLRKTDPSLWPELVQSFQASLAYRRQMEDKAKLASRNNDLPRKRAWSDPSQASATPPSTNAAPTTFDSNQTARAAANPAGPAAKIQSNPPANVVAATAPALADCASQCHTLADSASQSHPPPVANQPIDAKAAAAKSPELWPTADAGKVTPVSGATPTGGASQSWQDHLEAAIEQLQREAGEAPSTTNDVGQQVALRMMYLIDGRRDEALRPIAGVSPSQQDFWTKEFYGLSTYLDGQRIADPNRRAAEAVAQLQEAAQRLGESASLAVKNLAFCAEVKSYGVYKKFDKYEFRPEQTVILYAEVQNFKSESTEKGFHTSLRSSYQILDSRGNRVGEREFPVAEEYCQNPRRDFFFPMIFQLPKRLNDGDYTLQLTLEDIASQKLTQSTIPFSVKQ